MKHSIYTTLTALAIVLTGLLTGCTHPNLYDRITEETADHRGLWDAVRLPKIYLAFYLIY
jgi:hypothetical protein